MSSPPQVSFSAQVDLDRGPHRAAQLLLASLAGFLMLTLGWMYFAKLDISVQAVGKVVPSSRVQTIQSLEGGILRAIAVKEGQAVKRGELLGYVENLQYNAELGEGRQNQQAYASAIARLDAELSGRAPVFDARLRQQAPGLVAEQRRVGGGWGVGRAGHADVASAGAAPAGGCRGGGGKRREVKSSAGVTVARLWEFTHRKRL